MKKLSLALLVILIISCGKAPEMKTPNEGKSFEPLVGKSKKDILWLKYSNKINLECSVRVKKGSAMDLSSPATDSFSWDILNELSLMRVLNFRLGNIDTVVVVKIAAPINMIDSQTVIDEKQNEFYMEHSPSLTISYRHDSKTILTNGSIHETFKFKNVKLSENVETRIFTMTSEDNDENEITEDFRCTLKTQINKPYQFQWKKVR